jgi:hypothetical protein
MGKDQETAKGKMNNIRLGNPLGLVFNIPKSEANLQSITLYPARESRPHDFGRDKTGKASTIPKNSPYSFSIS